MNSEPTIFSRIINREIPAEIVFENENILVIKDIKDHPPVHLLGITKQPFENLHELLGSESNKDLLWELYSTLATIAASLGLSEKGYRLTTNIGYEGGQRVPHLHIHLLGGTVLEV